MGIAGDVQMVPQPGSQSPRAEGAAGIRVPPGREREPAQLSDRQSTARFKVEDQDIGPFFYPKTLQAVHFDHFLLVVWSHAPLRIGTTPIDRRPPLHEPKDRFVAHNSTTNGFWEGA